MIWVLLNRRQMGLIKKEFACLFLLLLMLFHLETQCFAEGFDRFGRLKGGSASKFIPAKSKGVLGGVRDEAGDEVFGVEKRKVHTGPNPLHNR